MEQTGSGKTFTITGGVEKYEDRGVIPRTLTYLFQKYSEVITITTHTCLQHARACQNMCMSHANVLPILAVHISNPKLGMDGTR